MNELFAKAIQCPYCGETIEILVDCSVPQQDYIEDCQVCCQPINFSVTVVDPENISVQVGSDNE
ncbi:MAG: CPXCG motif-containing cysteine-rich protein [Acidiferrobacterales bacterium]|nr:CPXCG motif-containing cysteine-rich protein [Acidiferrobacterales bacterium]